MNEDGVEPSADKGRCGQPVLSAFKSPAEFLGAKRLEDTLI